jgi:uroporphyrinogen decarboxylase
MPINGKELLRQVFSASPLQRIPSVPLLCSHAARLEQISTKEMLTDPTQLSKALQNAQTLYNYDAVTCVFDPTLEAEACGCQVFWGDHYEMPTVAALSTGDPTEISRIDINDITKRGRLPVVLEAALRLKIVLGRRVAIIGVVTGPFTLAASLIGADIIQEFEAKNEQAQSALAVAGKVAIEMCKAYCNLEIDGVMVADKFASRLPVKHSDKLRSMFAPLWNIVRFHNGYSILLTEKGDSNALESLCSSGADAVAAVFTTGFIELKTMIANKSNMVFGTAIPSTLLSGGATELEEYMTNYLRAGIDRRSFLTTEGEIPSKTSPEHIHGIMKAITSLRLGD